MSMTKVITQLEIKEYLGMKQAVFPEDAIITPAARDWAKDHQLQIVFAGSSEDKYQNSNNLSGADRNDLLKQVIMTVKTRLEKEGVPLSKDVVVQTVLTCLERLGCQIK